MNGVSYIPFPNIKAYRCSMYAAICMDNIQTDNIIPFPINYPTKGDSGH